ncbi:hypothetical protein VNO78_11105 [Psophocarpus tetragonolobus]|uniref:Uncharacterized protein n=1 Tax=Psophocarpus tetragonolobus TaxID=3891 RepID=A0AAN9XNC9_PSOTE
MMRYGHGNKEKKLKLGLVIALLEGAQMEQKGLWVPRKIEEKRQLFPTLPSPSCVTAATKWKRPTCRDPSCLHYNNVVARAKTHTLVSPKELFAYAL